jgi:hypothetical protein
LPKSLQENACLTDYTVSTTNEKDNIDPVFSTGIKQKMVVLPMFWKIVHSSSGSVKPMEGERS